MLVPSISCSYYPSRDFSATWQLPNLDDTCLSEESLYTDDGSESDDEDNGSGSESEDPTFILDESENINAARTLVSGVKYSDALIHLLSKLYKITY